MTRRTIEVGGMQGDGNPQMSVRTRRRKPGLLASPAFWIGGVASVVIWGLVLGAVFA